MDRMGLSPEQRAEFVELQRELGRRVRTSQPRMQEARMALYRELSAPRPDRAVIERQIVFLGRASAQLERAFAETALRSRDLLDPEQERMYLQFLSRRLRAARAAGDDARPGPGRRPPPAGPATRPRNR
jgi:Spy/CpxP family protein refolding chaperone